MVHVKGYLAEPLGFVTENHVSPCGAKVEIVISVSAGEG